MIECLLDFGADPNFRVSKVDIQTPWVVALTKVTLLYTIQSSASGPADYQAAEDKWNQTLSLLFSRGGKNANVPEARLSPLSRKILHDLQSKDLSKARTSWPKFW